jgi:hypothetical protein
LSIDIPVAECLLQRREGGLARAVAGRDVPHLEGVLECRHSLRREVTPTEQHVHSFLEMLPLMGLLIIVTLHWQQFLSLFGLGQETADFTLRLRQPPLPWLYVSTILSLVVLFEILPYLEELVRGIRHRKTKPSQG